MNNIIFIILALALFAGCKPSDKEIRADIAAKARQDLNFAGLQYTVNNGVVNFTGHCPSAKSFEKIKQKISNIHVIKSVNYQVQIAPVSVDLFTEDKLKVDSILANYPQVIAQILPSAAIFKGTLTAPERVKLMRELNANHITQIVDSLLLR